MCNTKGRLLSIWKLNTEQNESKRRKKQQFLECYNLEERTGTTSFVQPADKQKLVHADAFHPDNHNHVLHFTSMYLVILRSSAVPPRKDSRTFSAGRRAALIWSCRD